MSAPHDPPAFPNTGNSNWSMEPTKGMSLREFVAATVLPSIITVTSAGQHLPGVNLEGATMAERLVHDAFEIADAFIAQTQGANTNAD